MALGPSNPNNQTRGCINRVPLCSPIYLNPELPAKGALVFAELPDPTQRQPENLGKGRARPERCWGLWGLGFGVATRSWFLDPGDVRGVGTVKEPRNF